MPQISRRADCGSDVKCRSMPATERCADVSVIVPAFNVGRLVTEAIDSVLSQTVQPREIIVVDDGSTDDTAAQVETYGQTVRLIRQSNQGPGAARNVAARIAVGQWLGFLDADDTWLPEKLEKQIPYTTDPDVGLVHGGAFAADGSARAAVMGVTFDTLWHANVICTSTVLMRRAAFEELGGFAGGRQYIGVEDYNLWLRLASSKWTIIACPHPVSRYLPRDTSLSLDLERCARAELDNLNYLAEFLALPEDLVKRKRVEIYEGYGRDLLHARRASSAQILFWQALREEPSLKRLLLWLTSLVPVRMLDYRRIVWRRCRAVVDGALNVEAKHRP